MEPNIKLIENTDEVETYQIENRFLQHNKKNDHYYCWHHCKYGGSFGTIQGAEAKINFDAVKKKFEEMKSKKD
jgi:hypothetical protein